MLQVDYVATKVDFRFSHISKLRFLSTNIKNPTQGSDALFDVKPPPQLSFRLPLLFLTNYQILWSKYPDFVV